MLNSTSLAHILLAVSLFDYVFDLHCWPAEEEITFTNNPIVIVMVLEDILEFGSFDGRDDDEHSGICVVEI